MEQVRAFIFAGHVDHGKSTLMGHLYYLLGGIDPQKFAEIEKEAISDKMASWAFSRIFDILDHERLAGKTSEYVCVPVKDPASQSTFHLIDVPGHQLLVPQMIQGCARANVGVLVVSMRENELDRGISGETLEHLYIMRGMGIKNLIVALNKADCVHWDKEILSVHRQRIDSFIQKCRFPMVKYVATSGSTGENLCERKDSEEMSLLEAFQTVNPPEKKPFSKVADKPIWIQVLLLNLHENSGSSFFVSNGFSCIFHCGEKNFDVEVVGLRNASQKPCKFLKRGEQGYLRLKIGSSAETLCAENVILRSGNETIAMGKVYGNN